MKLLAFHVQHMSFLFTGLPRLSRFLGLPETYLLSKKDQASQPGYTAEGNSAAQMIAWRLRNGTIVTLDSFPVATGVL